MSMAEHDPEQRKQHVKDLCVNKGEPAESVAKAMNLPLATIEQDARVAYREAVNEILGVGRERIIVDAMRELNEQRARIKACLTAPETGDSARAKYEALMVQNSKDALTYFEKLEVAATGQAAENKLEQRLASSTFEEFNSYVGYPRHPKTNLPQKITKAQMRVFNAVDPVKHSWLCTLKSRQVGLSEVVLRTLAYHAFGKYRGKKIAIVLGTRIESTVEMFDRLKEIFRSIPDTVQLVGADVLKLKNGTTFQIFPASRNSINSFSKIGAMMIDEAAFFNYEEDRVILDAYLPIARTNRSDVFLISTANGPRGLFYHSFTSPEPSSWTKLEINIHEGGKELYTPEQIQEMINSSDEDPSASYLCKFVGGRDAVFGDLSEEDIDSLREPMAFD